MPIPSFRRLSLRSRFVLGAIAMIVIAAAATVGYWLPEARRLVGQHGLAKVAGAKHDSHVDDDHDAHAGESPDAHAGEKPNVHAGETPDAHAGESPDAHKESNAHAGEAADAHAGEEPDGHAGEKPDAHAGEAADAHAGEAADAHAGETEKPAAGKHLHNEAASVSLSPEAQANVGIQTAIIELKPFERTITVPAIITEQPGRSHVQIAAPLTGVVTRIYPTQGEAVAPGHPMFDLRLTHEEVVEAQGAFLQTAEELDVVAREIARLETVTADGAVAGKMLLERKYEQQKLKAMLRSQRQRLLLHGLTAAQVDEILDKRTLLSEMTVFVPTPTASSGTASTGIAPVLQVEKLRVDQGQHVNAGDLLCVMADYSELCIQGKAFEQDMPALNNATNRDWRVTAVIPSSDHQRQTVPDLKILSLANTVDADSRAFLFFVQLPNKLIRDRTTSDGHRFCAWQFKPGQRVEIQVPVERWSNRIVLPRDAVVQDGAESYVFEKIGGHFDRRPARVLYRDQYSVVLDAKGILKPGQTVVVAGADQILLALKSKSGGAPDPHAGHNH